MTDNFGRRYSIRRRRPGKIFEKGCGVHESKETML